MKFRGQNLGYLSFIFLEAKFGAPTRISEAKFGAKPPRPPNMEVPPGLVFQFHKKTLVLITFYKVHLAHLILNYLMNSNNACKDILN